MIQLPLALLNMIDYLHVRLHADLSISRIFCTNCQWFDCTPLAMDIHFITAALLISSVTPFSKSNTFRSANNVTLLALCLNYELSVLNCCTRAGHFFLKFLNYCNKTSVLDLVFLNFSSIAMQLKVSFYF